MLLSSVAETVYWMARYLERAEDTARLTQAYTHLVMDIPRGADLGWDILVKILDGEPIFADALRREMVRRGAEVQDRARTVEAKEEVVEIANAGDFDLVVIPGHGHGAADTPYGRRRLRDFLVRHLLGFEDGAGLKVSLSHELSLEKFGGGSVRLITPF